MRAVAVVLLLVMPLCIAQEADEAEVRRLVEQLGSRKAAERADALRRLALQGEAARPVLEGIETNDPEIARALRGLLRRPGELVLEIEGAPGSHRVGERLELQVALVNDTGDSWLLPLRRGSSSAFTLVVGPGAGQPLRPDEVAPARPEPEPCTLLPGEVLRVTIRLEGERTLLRRPGRHRLALHYLPGPVGRLPHGGPIDPDRNRPETVSLNFLATRVREIEATVCEPAELEAALADPRLRPGAVAELRVREDPGVLGVLRAHSGDPDLRAVAVTRLGALGKRADLPFLIAATEDPDLAVRRAAAEALGHFDDPRARRRLVALTHDRDLTEAAVRGLARRKHAGTIDCFVLLLKRSYREPRATEVALRALREWTGLHVANRKDEIESFERWWKENRERWIRENVSGNG